MRTVDDVSRPSAVCFRGAEDVCNSDRITIAHQSCAADSQSNARAGLHYCARYRTGHGLRACSDCLSHTRDKLKVGPANSCPNREVLDCARFQPPTERIINFGMNRIGDLLARCRIAYRRTAICLKHTRRR